MSGGVVEVVADMPMLTQWLLAGGALGGVVSGVSYALQRRTFRLPRDDVADQAHRAFQVFVNGDHNVVQIGGDGMAQRARRTTPAPLPAAEDDDYCVGCQRTRGSWSMAWLDDDYLCRECRGLPPVTALQELLHKAATVAEADETSVVGTLPIIASAPSTQLYPTVAEARAALGATGGKIVRETGKRGRCVGYTIVPAEPNRHDTPLELAQQRWLARQKSSEQSSLVLPPRGPYPETEADIDNQQRCTCPQCAQNRPPAIRRVFDNTGRQTEVLPGSLVDQVLWPTDPTLDELRMHAERWEAEGL